MKWRNILLVIVGLWLLGMFSALWPATGKDTAPSAPTASVPTPRRGPKELTGDKVTNMGLVIRTLGYACGQPEAAWYQSPGPYGMEFKVLCETGWFQVILTPQDTFRVATWSTRLR